MIRQHPRLLDMPLVRLFVAHGLLGGFVGLGLVAALLIADIAALRTLMAQTIGTGVGGAMLGFTVALAFAGLAIATAIMLLPADDKTRPPGHRRSARSPTRPMRPPSSLVPMPARSGHRPSAAEHV